MKEKQERAFECIKEILTGKEHSKIFGIDPFKVKPESKLRQDLGLDSLDTYELVFYTEGGLKVKIPDEIINGFETIQNIMDFAAGQM